MTKNSNPSNSMSFYPLALKFVWGSWFSIPYLTWVMFWYEHHPTILLSPTFFLTTYTPNPSSHPTRRQPVDQKHDKSSKKFRFFWSNFFSFGSWLVKFMWVVGMPKTLQNVSTGFYKTLLRRLGIRVRTLAGFGRGFRRDSGIQAGAEYVYIWTLADFQAWTSLARLDVRFRSRNRLVRVLIA